MSIAWVNPAGTSSTWWVTITMVDAVPSAARYLCAAGAGTPAGLPQAILAYNHAAWYVSDVLALASEYAQQYG